MCASRSCASAGPRSSCTATSSADSSTTSTPTGCARSTSQYDRPVPDLDDLFAELRELLTRHGGSLTVVRDDPGDVQIETARSGPSGTRLPFGSVQGHEQHVS